MTTKTIKTRKNETHIITKSHKEYIFTSSHTTQNKWIWRDETGAEWTPMRGEWRRLENRYDRTGSIVVGKTAVDWDWEKNADEVKAA